MFVGKFKGYPIYLSDKKEKKYYAMVNNRKVYFGDSSYEHYKDYFGKYKNLDHHDKERRRRYFLRHGLEADEGTAKWFSHYILWSK